jgi:hypothetical protein
MNLYLSLISLGWTTRPVFHLGPWFTSLGILIVFYCCYLFSIMCFFGGIRIVDIGFMHLPNVGVRKNLKDVVDPVGRGRYRNPLSHDVAAAAGIGIHDVYFDWECANQNGQRVRPTDTLSRTLINSEQGSVLVQEKLRNNVPGLVAAIPLLSISQYVTLRLRIYASLLSKLLPQCLLEMDTLCRRI